MLGTNVPRPERLDLIGDAQIDTESTPDNPLMEAGMLYLGIPDP
jgi:hypothetical protein